MSRFSGLLVLSLVLLLARAGSASAQSTGAAAGSQPDAWNIAIYPVLAWVPFYRDLDFSLPPLDIGDENRGSLNNLHLHGAFLGGLAVSHGIWRFDVNGIWASIGGDRVERPTFSVGADFYYGYGSFGIKVAKEFYVTGGVRRLAFKYDFVVPEGTDFSRKIGVWDPIIGVGYHHVARKFEVHGIFEGGGFGVGTDSEYAASLRVDWKPVTHFGLSGGYSFLKLKVSDDVLSRELVARETLHGPTIGIGLYF